MKHRRKDILAAAAEVVATEGLGVSTARLAKAAGVSNGTLFNYFATKQELLDALYLQLKGELCEAIGEITESLPLRQQAQAIWDRTIDWAMASPHKLQVSHLLREADLITPVVARQGEELVATPMAVMERLDRAGILLPLPFDYLNAVIQAQIQLAVTSGLSAEQRAVAFDAIWRSVTITDQPPS